MYFREIKKKINLLGNPAVGKTSLILRYVKDVFGDGYLKTIGTNVYSKDVEIIGANVKLMIQDVMGEKSYESVHENSFRGSAGAIFVADATRIDTLDDIFDYWIPKYESITGDSSGKILTVNKTDLDDIEIEREYVLKELSRDFEHIFFTSAKTGDFVEEAFNEMASRVLFKTATPGKSAPKPLDEFSLDTPQDLLGALFYFSSGIEGFEYSDMEGLSSQSGIDIFALEAPIKEKNISEFAKRLVRWCQDNSDEECVNTMRDIVNRYKKRS